MSDPLAPPPSLLCKLASIAVHADEARSSDGHLFDQIAFDNALKDPEVIHWVEQMTRIGMAPVKRS
jgi:hypothetical protein